MNVIGLFSLLIISLESYFITILTTSHWDIYGRAHFFLNTYLGFLKLYTSGSANAYLSTMFKPLDVLLEYLINYATMGSVMSNFYFQLGYSTGGSGMLVYNLEI